MPRFHVLHMTKRRAEVTALPYSTRCHTFRATGITTYLQNRGTLEHAKRLPTMSPAHDQVVRPRPRGAPTAYEDHPQRTLYAALRLQEGLRTYSARLIADGGTPLEARVGINTGEVVVRTVTSTGHSEYTPIGQFCS